MVHSLFHQLLEMINVTHKAAGNEAAVHSYRQHHRIERLRQSAKGFCLGNCACRLVGEACPLVSPYIWLSWTKTFTLMFLLIAVRRWLLLAVAITVAAKNESGHIVV